MNSDKIFDELKSIPHLQLPLKFDVEIFKKELKHIDSYEGYRKTKNEDEKTFDLYYNNWKGRGLIDIVPDSRMSMMRSPSATEKTITSIDNKTTLTLELDENNNIKTYITDLGEKMTECVKAIYSVTDYPLRARISKITANGNITWHSHFQNFLGKNTVSGSKKWRHVIIHIPIITNPNMLMAVTKFPYSENPQQEIFYKNYEPGNAYIFNGWHDHNVFNKSTEDRIHIMFYAPLFDQKLLNHITQSLENYNGPRIL
jgi:hypothetical protein